MKTISAFFGSLLRDGGPSSSRLINLVVAITGAWLLYYWARSGGEMGWPWAVSFMAYLAYGAGPLVLRAFFDVLKTRGGGGEAKSQAPKPDPAE